MCNAERLRFRGCVAVWWVCLIPPLIHAEGRWRQACGAAFRQTDWLTDWVTVCEATVAFSRTLLFSLATNICSNFLIASEVNHVLILLSLRFIHSASLFNGCFCVSHRFSFSCWRWCRQQLRLLSTTTTLTGLNSQLDHVTGTVTTMWELSCPSSTTSCFSSASLATGWSCSSSTGEWAQTSCEQLVLL